MVIMPRGTTMIQARDAMLAADLARYTANPAWGDNQRPALAGLRDARLRQHENTVSNADANPVPAFDAPSERRHQQRDDQLLRGLEGRQRGSGERADLRGRLLGPRDADRGHGPGHGGRPARTPRATSTTRRRSCPTARARSPAARPRRTHGGTYYNFVAVAPGYGHVRFRVKNLKAGRGPRTSRSTCRRTTRRRRRARRSRPTLPRPGRTSPRRT